jgi:hypothetical protein
VPLFIHAYIIHPQPQQQTFINLVNTNILTTPQSAITHHHPGTMADAGIPSTTRSGRRLSGIRIIPPSLLHPNMAASPHSASFPRHVDSQASPHPDFLPPLPRDMLPGEMRSSSRSDHITEADAREKLSDFVIYKFEKAQNPNLLDEEGYPVKPSWDRVNRALIAGYSRREVARMVRELNKKTLPTQEKKEGLSEPIQRQIDMAYDELARAEHDPRYQYVLAQIDCELRQRDSSDEREEPKRSRSNRRKSSSSRKSKSKTRRTLERVSVTAYFKRTPRIGEDVLSMYKSRVRDSSARLSPSPRHHHRHRQHHSHQHVDPRTSQPPPSLSPSPLDYIPQIAEERRRRYSEASPAPTSSSSTRDPGSTAVQVGPRDSHESHSARESPKTSRSSLCSDDVFSALGLEDTPRSSVDGSSLTVKQPRHTRFRSRSPSRERPRPPPRTRSPSPTPYAIDSPRHDRYDDDNYVWVNPRTAAIQASASSAHQSRSLPINVDDKYLKPRSDARRVAEPRERERGRERRRDRHHYDDERQRYRSDDTQAQEQQQQTPSSSKDHPRRSRRGSVRFVSADEWDDGSSKDVDRRLERLNLGGEHRVRFSDEASSGSRRDKERRKRRSADMARYQDDIFRMEDFA